jgi:hypothetical protein
MRTSKVLFVLMALASGGLTGSLDAQEPLTSALEIRLASGTPLEQQGRQQLERLLAKWDLSRWLFTRTVHIQSRVIPHSHPILTLNTQYLDNDAAQLATFLHEQLHWFLLRDQAALASAMAGVERLYPEVPDALPEGARGRRSTYLHLLVCLLEFDAVRELLGETAAREALGAFPYYTWVYREVLERPDPIRQILRTYGLDVPHVRP